MISKKKRETDGLYAIGGDLRPERLIEAYAQGIFPWSDFHRKEILWYCPMDRFIIFPSEIHISHPMRTLLNKEKYQVSIDKNFEDVIGTCSELRIDKPGAWLGPQMVGAYTKLHYMEYAHSIEVWEGGILVGGPYGIELNECFFGESMFSKYPSASKVGLIFLSKYLSKVGGKFIDCQFETPHLLSMGGRHISYEEYMGILYNQGSPVKPCVTSFFYF